VRIEAEMKTPSSATPIKLDLLPAAAAHQEAGAENSNNNTTGGGGTDLTPTGDASSTLQKILAFDLKEEGNHVLAVTVSYYEASALSGRTRTFRKLYQFICKPSLIVRTKPGTLAARHLGGGQRRWVLEAQLENCSEEWMLLERVGLELEAGLTCQDCNGTLNSDDDGGGGGGDSMRGAGATKPVLLPGETEQVCFLVEEEENGKAVEQLDGRVVFGVLQIGWRSEMGNRGCLSTGKLGTRFGKETPRIGT
jgi:hypothetical protein